MKRSEPGLILSSVLFVTLLAGVMVLQRYLALRFESASMNFVRYTVGGIGFWIGTAIRPRSRIRNVFASRWTLPLLLLISCLLFGNMYFFLMGLRYTNAVTGTLFRVLAIPISTTLAAYVIPAERSYTMHPLFILGMSAAIAASIGYILVPHSADVAAPFRIGGLYLLLSVLLYSIQNVLVRRVRAEVSTPLLSSVTATAAALLFLAVAAAKGTIGGLWQAAPWELALLVFSGITGLAVGMGLGFAFIRRFGVGIFNVVSLTVPVVTGLLGFAILGELPSWQRALFGMFTLAACAVAVFAYSRTAQRNTGDARRE